MIQPLSPSFVPHRLLRCPHRQTLAGAYLTRRTPYVAVQHTIELNDGDQLQLHEDRGDRWQTGDPTSILVHGLAGCHESGYMNRMAARLSADGIRVFRLDLRGCGAGAATARHSLHAGRTQDLFAAIQWIHEQCDGSPLVMIGYSLGAAILLKLLGELGTEARSICHSAVAVSPPIDLATCSRSLPLGVNQLYDRNFARVLSKAVQHRRRQRPDLIDVAWNRRPRTLLEFDSVFTAPLGGFRDVEHYYREASANRQLCDIDVPTRILIAKDDPLIPWTIFEEAQLSDSTRVFAADHGGHLGFLSDRRADLVDPDWHWMDWRILDWVRADFRQPAPCHTRLNRNR